MPKYKLDYFSLFTGLGKAAFKLYSGDKLGALQALGESIKLKEKDLSPEEAAEKILSVAMPLAALHLIEQHRSEFLWLPESKKAANKELTEFLKGTPPAEVELTPRFYRDLADSDAVKQFTHHFETWLRLSGYQGNTTVLARRLPWPIKDAVLDEYKKHIANYRNLEQYLASEAAAEWQVELGWEKHRAHFMTLLHGPVFGEPYSLPDVFIWPRAFYTERSMAKRGEADRKEVRHAVKLRESLDNWLGETDKDDAVRVITGGPGAGKSSSTRMWASERMETGEWKVLFVPIHELDVESRHFKDALEEYCSESGYPVGVLDDQTAPSRVLLILDGLDELAKQGEAGKSAAELFVDEVLKVVENRNRDALKLKVVFCGRPVPVQEVENRFKKVGQILELLPYFVPENEHAAFSEASQPLLKPDQRRDWWAKYAPAVAQPAEMPSVLTDKRLSEVTAQPLLCHLVAMALRQGAILTDEEFNKAKVYDHLLRMVYQRDWAKHTGDKPGHIGTKPFETFEHFRDLLAVLGLVAWHGGGGRGARLSAVKAQCTAIGLKELYDAYEAAAPKNTASLFTTFYMRHTGRVKDADPAFEFTHKSFGDYLSAVHLANTLEVFANRWKAPKDPGSRYSQPWTAKELLLDWIGQTGQSPLTREQYEFLCGEVQLRKSHPESPLDVPKAQTACKELFEANLADGMPAHELKTVTFHQMTEHELKTVTFHQMTEQAANAEHALLCLLGACVLATRNPTGRVRSPAHPGRWSDSVQLDDWREKCAEWAKQQSWLVRIDWPSNTAAADFIRRVRKQTEHFGSQLDPLAWVDLDFHLQRLQGCDLSWANLSRANLSRTALTCAALHGTHLDGAYLDGARLDGANLSWANLTGTSLTGADLTRAILYGTNLTGATLDGADLTGANLATSDLIRASLVGADLTGVDLAVSSLQGATLDGADLTGATLDGADLTGATLVGADLTGVTLGEAKYGKVKLDTPEGRELLIEKGAIL